jgi:arylsulfatase
VIEPGSVCNEIISNLDWLPTLRAAAGEPDVKEKLLKGHQEKTFNVHPDGYNFLPYCKGEAEKGPRVEYFYFSDVGDLMAFRYDHWQLVFMEQRVTRTLQIWAEPLVTLRVRGRSTCAPIPTSGPTSRRTRV